jgi:hypothetical protein
MILKYKEVNKITKMEVILVFRVVEGEVDFR